MRAAANWLLTGIGALALVLALVDIALFSTNRQQQSQVAERAQFIQQSAQLQGLYQQIIGSLAELSAKNNDAQLKAVLADQGITFSTTPSNDEGAKAK